MTDDRSLERVARSWLELGPTEAPDHAVDAALLRIQTTTQERDWRAQLPRRNHPMTMPARLMAAAIAIAVVTVGGILILRPGGPKVAATASPSPSTSPIPGSPTPSNAPSASARQFDYSTMGGRILVNAFGNAPDGSESSSDSHIDRQRLYWMDPASMVGETAVELLPGWTGNGTGKTAPDVSPDGKTIVFQEAGTDYPQLWSTPTTPLGIQLAETQPVGNRCVHVAKCAEVEPAWGPNGMLAYVVEFGGQAWIQVDGPGEGQTRGFHSTQGSDANNVPEALSVSPDGSKIAFERVTYDGDTIRRVHISILDVATDQTTVLNIPLVYPGDPDWLPDGSRIILTDGPLAMAPVPLGSADRTAEVYSIAPDGSDLRRLTNTHGQAITAHAMSNGQILYFNNYFWVVNADGSDPRPVNLHGQDLSTPERGFDLFGVWVAP